MKLMLFALLLLPGCAASQHRPPASRDAARAACRSLAIYHAQTEADRLCPLPMSWVSCPHSNEIEDELMEDLVACDG